MTANLLDADAAFFTESGRGRSYFRQLVLLTALCFPEVQEEYSSGAAEHSSGDEPQDLEGEEASSDQFVADYLNTWIGLHDLAASRFLLLVDPSSDRVVAMAGYHMYHDSIFLYNLAVHPDHRRRRLARRLWIYCEEVARERGYTKLSGNVMLKNRTNLGIYTSHGAKILYNIGNKQARIVIPVSPEPRPLHAPVSGPVVFTLAAASAVALAVVATIIWKKWRFPSTPK